MAKKKLFQKSEMIYLILAGLSILALTYIIIQQNINDYVSSLNPIVQFVIINLGMYIVFFLFLKGIALKSKQTVLGALGGIISFMAIDLVMPEYHVGLSGLVSGGIFGKSAIDYVFGYIYTGLGFSGLTLVILVYPVTFAVLFIIGSILVKNFVKTL